MAADAQKRRDRVLRAGPYLVAAIALAALVWRPDGWMLGTILLLAVPTIWRAIGLPLQHLATMEGLALLATLVLRAYCSSSGCGIDYMHPWHFLPDLTMVLLTAAPIGLGLAALAPLARWSRRRGDKASRLPGLARVVLLGVATIGLAFVFYVVSPFVSMPHGSAVLLALTWGIPLGLSAATGFAVRSWVPALVAIAIVFAANVDAVASCEAGADESTECIYPYFMEPQREPVAHGTFAFLAVGAAAFGSWRAKRGLPLVALPRNPRVPR